MVECNFIAFTVCIFANVKETGILARKTVYLQVIQLPKNIGKRVSKSFDRVDIIVIIMENLKSNGMRELTVIEMREVNGGFIPALIIGLSFVAMALYGILSMDR